MTKISTSIRSFIGALTIELTNHFWLDSHSVYRLRSFKFTSKITRSRIVQNYISYLHLLDWYPRCQNRADGRRNRYFHGPLRFIARASCLLRIRIDFVWEEKVVFCRKNGSSKRYLFAFVPNTKARALLFPLSLRLSTRDGIQKFPKYRIDVSLRK